MANSTMGELIFFMRGNKVKSKKSLEKVKSKIRDEFKKELERPRRKRYVLMQDLSVVILYQFSSVMP